MATSNYILFESVGQSAKKVKELSIEEFNELNDIETNYNKFRYLKWKMQEVELNYDSLFEGINKYEIKSQNSTPNLNDIENYSIDLNRLLTNFISSFKFFADFLKSESLKSKKEIVDGNVISKYYDDYLSYRFFYNLRNYSQHYTFPIGYVYIQTNLNTFSRKLEIGFTKSKLFQDRAFRDKLKESLLKYNETFPLRPLLFDILTPLKYLKYYGFLLYKNDIIKTNCITEKYRKYLSTSASTLDFGIESIENEVKNIKGRMIDFELGDYFYSMLNKRNNFT